MSSADSPQSIQNMDSAVSPKDETMQKTREREERLRLARERLKEEQKRKLEELRESMERAEEVRRKQEENRRKKIEEIKQREELHRAGVEERRKKLLDEDNERKQAILRKTAEREAKLEMIKLKKGSVPSSFGHSKSFRSEGALSCIVRSPPVLVRPQSVAERLPSYAYNTVSSQIRVSRVDDLTRNSVGCVCPRFRSAPPLGTNRAKSMGNIRKSRADLRKTIADSMILSSGTSADIVQQTVTRKVSRKEAAENRALSRAGISKSVSSAESLGASTIRARSPASSRASVLSTRLSKPPPTLGSPPVKKMPSPLPVLAPKPQSRTLKDANFNTNLGSGRKIVKAVHEINIQPLKSDKQKELSSKEEKEPQKLNFSSGEMNVPEKKGVSVEEEYKKRLAEKRRMAREKAERDAEEERLREEEQRRKEEEHRRLEEEEQRKREEEELRLAEDARKQEEERFRVAVEAAECQRREEEERLEAERQEKLAADKKMQEEAEKKEKERQEKSRREEEERQERKKKLEMIMKRVKPDENVQKEAKDSKPDKEVPASPGVEEKLSRFLSPLLRQIMGNKLKGKPGESSVPSSTPESSSHTEEEEEVKHEASSEVENLTKENLVELFDEKSDSSVISSSISQLDSEKASVPCTADRQNEADGIFRKSHRIMHLDDSSVSDLAHLESGHNGVDISSCDPAVIKGSDDNQNWTISPKDSPEPTIISDQPLPDLPRIAFEENSLNTLPDILL